MLHKSNNSNRPSSAHSTRQQLQTHFRRNIEQNSTHQQPGRNLETCWFENSVRRRARTKLPRNLETKLASRTSSAEHSDNTTNTTRLQQLAYSKCKQPMGNSTTTRTHIVFISLVVFELSGNIISSSGFAEISGEMLLSFVVFEFPGKLLFCLLSRCPGIFVRVWFCFEFSGKTPFEI